MIDKTLPVAAIKNGTVIDHIRPGQAHRLMHLFFHQRQPSTLLKHLKSLKK